MSNPTIPTYRINHAEVDEAYEAYRATQMAVQSDPSLIENKYFKALQDTAYARFLLNFEALK